MNLYKNKTDRDENNPNEKKIMKPENHPQTKVFNIGVVLTEHKKIIEHKIRVKYLKNFF